MLLEPPRADVPARARLTVPPAARDGAVLGAAMVLAALADGHLAVVAVVFAVLGRSAPSALAVVLAVAALAVRWGTGSLDAVAGAQSVLGPAGSIGTDAAVAGAWFAATAIVLAARRSPGDLGRWTPVPYGLLAAVAVAGGTAGTDLLLRGAASAVGVGAALAVATVADRQATVRRSADAVAIVAGTAAVLVAFA